MMARLVLPLPPSDNAAHRLVMRGSHPARIRTDATKQYEHEAGWLAKVWAHRYGWQVPPVGTPVIERLWIWWPDHRTHDPANLFKVLHDSVKGILVVDDDQIWPQVWGVAWDKRHPRVEMEWTVREETDDAPVPRS